MSEAKFESIARQLREAAPPAPERLRGLVHTLPSAQPRRALRLRPALSAAIAIAVAVGLGAALIGGLSGSPPTRNVANFAPPDVTEKGAGKVELQASPHARRDKLTFSGALAKRAPNLTPGTRLQRYDVAMRLRVKDLSRSTQAAVRQTRRLGGYLAAADYATGRKAGDSRLELRVPIGRIQQAIAGFTDLGTILAQHISLKDLQAPLDRTDRRIAAARKVIAVLEGKSFRTPDEQARLDAARRTVQRLSRQHASLVREGAFAKISLQLTTRKAAAQHVAPGRFERFWGDAGDILGKEAIAVLYALVVAGPFAILAVLALLAERTRRRRADHRLLGETG
jgi:uncharacterized protein DUF4349